MTPGLAFFYGGLVKDTSVTREAQNLFFFLEAENAARLVIGGASKFEQ